MTTTAMIFGMLPLFFGLGEGAEFRAPMARAVVGGLITSTLLTLIVVPVVYTLLDDVAAWLLGRKKTAAAVGTAAMSVALLFAGAQPASAQQYGASSSAGPAPSLALQVEQAATAAAPSGVKVLTLDQALAIAAAQNRDIQKAIEYKNWVQGKYVEERASALPQGTFTASFTRKFDNSQSKLFSGLHGRWRAAARTVRGHDRSRRDLRRPAGRLARQLRRQAGRVHLGPGRRGHPRRQARLRVQRPAAAPLPPGGRQGRDAAFYNVLAARELVRIAEENLAQKARRLDEVDEAAGGRHRHRLRRAGGPGRRWTARSRRSSGRRTPCAPRASSCGSCWPNRRRSTSRARSPRRSSRCRPTTPLLATALQNRPELGEIDATQGIYSELVTIAGAGNKPRVDFAADWGKRHLGLPSISSTGTAWNAGIFATVPLFDGWRTKGQVAQARSDLASVNLDELKLRDGITLEVRTAVDARRRRPRSSTRSAAPSSRPSSCCSSPRRASSSA